MIMFGKLICRSKVNLVFFNERFIALFTDAKSSLKNKDMIIRGQLSRCSTARGFDSRLGLTKVKAHKSFSS